MKLNKRILFSNFKNPMPKSWWALKNNALDRLSKISSLFGILGGWVTYFNCAVHYRNLLFAPYPSLGGALDPWTLPKIIAIKTWLFFVSLCPLDKWTSNANGLSMERPIDMSTNIKDGFHAAHGNIVSIYFVHWVHFSMLNGPKFRQSCKCCPLDLMETMDQLDHIWTKWKH